MLFKCALILLSIFYNAEAAPDRNKVYCIISGLKENGLLTSDLPTIPFLGSPVNCLRKFDDNINDLYVSINEQLLVTFKEEKPEIITCIMDEIKFKKMASYLLKEIAFEGDVKLEASVGEEVIEENKKTHTNIFQRAIFDCKLKKEMETVFDDLLTAANQNKTDIADNDLESLYCINKYVVNNNLIDTEMFKVVLKDPNVDTDCTPIIQKEFKELETELIAGLKTDEDAMTDDQADCAIQKYRSKNYTDFIFSILVLGKQNPNEEQKIIYREKFTKTMLDISYEVVECL